MPPPMRMGPRFAGPRDFLTDEEKKNMPKITSGLLLRISGYLKPYLPQFIFVFIALLLSSVIGLFPSVIIGKIVDTISSGGEVSRLIILLLTAFGVLTLAQVISVVENYINSWISQKIIFDMKNQMYSHLQTMSHSFFMTEKQGDIITRMNSDINGVSSVISGTLTSLVSNLLIAVTTFVLLFCTDWRLALLGVVLIPCLLLPTKIVSKKRWKLLYEAQEHRDRLNQQINETLSVSGSMLIKLFTREQQENQKFTDINKDVTNITIKEHRTGSWFHVFMRMFMEIGPLLVYFLGGYLVLTSTSNTLTIGQITVMVTLINRLYGPIRTLTNIHVDFTRSLALFTRIFDYYDRPCEIHNCENPVKPDISGSDIVFDDVHFSYNEKSEILKGINFVLPHGKTFAVVGTSGAGKSTLINLLPRLYDVTSGSITIAGEDIRNFDIKFLRENIGIVSQDTYLFNGTIMQNLMFANNDASEEEIINACKTANIHDFIASLPDGYETIVGNRGLKLSGGEKQRISIARVILKNPKILILDEATSSLDSISENAIQEALSKIMNGRTCLVIAHRLSTILGADKIIVLENGTITEEGTHEQLINANGKYRTLYETQFRKIIDRENAIKDTDSID